MLRAFALASVLLLAACGSTTPTPACNASNCPGCCNSNDRCVEGNQRDGCGANGGTCSVCTEAQYCIAGACSDSPPCKYVNAECTSDAQCCAGLFCTAGRCISGTTCRNPGATCNTNEECCSIGCQNGTCLDASNCNAIGQSCSPCCGPNLTCVSGTCQQVAQTCGQFGSSCAFAGGNACCGTLSCQSGVCR